MKIVWLVIGGSLGTLARYFSGVLVLHWLGSAFPYATLGVNLTGSFLAGLLWGVFDARGISTMGYTFLFIGFLGGFTTFSAYSLESLHMIRQADFRSLILNILANNVLGILLCFTGFELSRKLILNLN